MRQLSISAAWEETRAILARDGGLLMTVALALIALPSVVSGLINPGGMSSGGGSMWADLIAFIASVIALAGQLALNLEIRLLAITRLDIRIDTRNVWPRRESCRLDCPDVGEHRSARLRRRQLHHHIFRAIALQRV